MEKTKAAVVSSQGLVLARVIETMEAERESPLWGINKWLLNGTRAPIIIAKRHAGALAWQHCT